MNGVVPGVLPEISDDLLGVFARRERQPQGSALFVSPKVEPTGESARENYPRREANVAELRCARQEPKEGDNNSRHGETRRDRCSVAPVPVVSVVAAAVRAGPLGYGHGFTDDVPGHIPPTALSIERACHRSGASEVTFGNQDVPFPPVARCEQRQCQPTGIRVTVPRPRCPLSTSGTCPPGSP